VKPLVEFADRHPGTTGAAGAASAVITCLVNELHSIASVAADVAVLLGCLATGLSVLLLAHRWRHRNDPPLPTPEDFHRPIRKYRRPYLPLDPDDPLP
jgi:hypothetical protein